MDLHASYMQASKYVLSCLPFVRAPGVHSQPKYYGYPSQVVRLSMSAWLVPNGKGKSGLSACDSLHITPRAGLCCRPGGSRMHSQAAMSQGPETKHTPADVLMTMVDPSM